MTTDARTIRDAEALAKRSICVLHPDVPLRIEMAQDKPNLWCRKCQGRPASMQTRQSLTSKYKQGMPIAAAIEPHMRRKYGAWTMLDEQTRAVVLRQPDETAIATVVKQFQIAQPDVVKLPLPEQIKVAQLVAAYDLQPFHIHIQDYKKQGGGFTYSMALTYEGRLFCAKSENSMGQTFAGVTARAMNADERRDNMIPDGQAASVAIVKQIVAGKPEEIASGIGRAGIGKDDGSAGKKNPIAMAHPQEIADTRAKRRALAEAAPLGIAISTLTPEGRVDDDNIIEGEGRVLDDAAEALPEADVDTETGEIDREVNVDGPDGEPIPRPMTKDHPAIVKVKEYLDGLDYPPGEDFVWLEHERQDGVVVGLHALVAMLHDGWSPEQVVHFIVTKDPARQEEEPLAW